MRTNTTHTHTFHTFTLPRLQDPASQLAQLVALEHLLAVTLPERAKETPLALKQLYDADVIAEELMLAW